MHFSDSKVLVFFKMFQPLKQKKISKISIFSNMELPVFCRNTSTFARFLTQFETKMNIITSTKDYEFNLNNENPSKRKINLYDDYMDKFEVNSLKASLSSELENILCPILACQQENCADFKKSFKNIILIQRE